MASPADFDLIRISSGKNRSALRLAERAHRGVTRKTDPDTPYILHPMYVATVLAAAGADRNLVCAGCLHDVVEDTDVTIEQIEREFGAEVARLVAAVTKDPQTKAAPLDRQAQMVADKVDQAGEDAVALKAADLLANITDLVLDAEEHGPDLWVQVLGKGHDPGRALAKIDHYLQLAALLEARLLMVRDTDRGPRAPRYPRLAAALRFRAQELRQLRDRWR